MSATPSWWLDEAAHAGAEHLDPSYVAGYEQKAGYDPSDDVGVLAGLGIGADSTVVDLGAGTGVFTEAIAALAGAVVAVDVSPAMVEVLHRRVAERRLDNVTVAHAGFLSYEHDGSPADAVFTRNALHQLPDLWKVIALDRIAGIVRPGGILRLHDLVFDFDADEAHERIEAWMSGAVDDPAVGYTGADLAEHVRAEFSTYRWLFEPMLDRAGFEIIDVAYVRAAYGAYTCRRR
ncbi:MAG: class I SAM-dependent methyltransferase [Actinomycetota bacterium]|nr:class I SAM-dependent methyltransferase [Actinomycetota bacterium]